MLTLNLLPDIKKDLLRVQRERNLVIYISAIAISISIGILVLMLTTWSATVIYDKATRGSIRSDEDKIKLAQKNKQLNKYLTIQNQLKQVDALKKKQQYYSRLYDYLISLNPASPNDIVFRNLTLKTDAGKITMLIEGRTENFAALDVYKNTLEKALLVYDKPINSFKNNNKNKAKTDKTSSAKDIESAKEKLLDSVRVRESSLSSSSTSSTVAFTLLVAFNPKAFSQSIKNPIIEVPKEVTSDGDRHAPKMTFTKEANNKASYKQKGNQSNISSSTNRSNGNHQDQAISRGENRE